MKKLLLVAIIGTALFAQTPTTPIQVDWRFRLYWENPNPPGSVANWIVYSMNTTTGLRSIGSSTTNLVLLTLLNGQPAGVYTLYTTAVSTLGVEGDRGEQISVYWPGGNGKLKGGWNPHVQR